jgi:hypothetical protein
MTFPFPQSCPDEALLARWEALLGKSPRLAPWLDQTLRGRRSSLQGRAVGVEIERILWRDLTRWLTDFEALPPHAVAAIATTLEEQKEAKSIRIEPADSVAESAERSLSELETLAADPTFALAFHCVEARITPLLSDLVPRTAWFGMLHASAPSDVLMNPGVAVALVLRLASGDWQNLPSERRRAALRAFLLGPGDLRASPAQLQKLCLILPFRLSTNDLPALAATSAKLRRALPEASSLCARIVARLTSLPGGLALLHQPGAAERADESEVAELRATSRRQTRMAGFDRLLRLV